jgi:hypothetical protein
LIGGEAVITILDPSKKPLAILEDYFNDEIAEQINGAYTLKFSVYLDDEKSPYISMGNIAEAEGQWFNIARHRRTRSDNGNVVIAVECEQLSYDLLFTVFEGGFIHTGSPTELLNRALEGTGFTAGTVQPGGLISIDLKEGVTARAVVMEIAAQTGAELRFDKYNVSLLTRRGQDRGVQFRLGKNIKGIVKDVNGQSGEVLTAYEVDIVELNTLPEFEGLEYFELGDTVDIIDEELQINEKQRIIEYSFSPKRRINSSVTIANYIEGIQDTIYRIQTTTVGKDKWMYGVKIGPDEGIVIERYDKLAKSIWNADEFRMQKGDGSGSYTDAIYFDPIGGQYEFTGIVRAGQFIGGSIKIGNNFSVDEEGYLIATGATFTGGAITGALFRTAVEGHRIEINGDAFTAYSSSGGEMLSIGQGDGGGGIVIMDNGSPRGSIYGDSEGLRIGNMGGIIIQSVDDYTYMKGPVDFFGATARGLEIESVNGLRAAIDEIWSYLYNRAVINGSFDDDTRNLKLYSSLRTVATINIPTGIRPPS